MFQQYSLRIRRVFLLALLAALPALSTAASGGPSPSYDAPSVHSPVTQPPKAEPKVSTGMKILQAISWYIPNRIADIFDVPKAHISLGSGLGANVRATKYFFFSYFDTETNCIGWEGRKMESAGSIFFHEKYDEKYLGFLAAQQGKLQHDPSEVGLSLHLWALGVNFALSGAELLDAVTGIVGVDLMGDDHGPVLFDNTEEKKTEPQAQEATAPPAETVAPTPSVVVTPTP